MAIRQPAVADRFYPGNPNQLRSTVNDLLSAHTPDQKSGVIGIISPHAGYIYSGSVCAETLKAVPPPETVIILGPNHHGRGEPIALAGSDWNFPCGTVKINSDLSTLVQQHLPEARVDDTAHQLEHSLEVQVPFLHHLNPHVTIVPLVLSQLSYSMCEKVGKAIAKAVEVFPSPVLLLASSDMSHYESREHASKKDLAALENVTSLDPRGLYDTVFSQRISMCGIIPVTVMLSAAKLLGANCADIIRYTDSGAVSGDTEQVVGYAGGVVYRKQ